MLVEDPAGDARLLLETRSGSDDTPLAYYVVDDFGRDKEAPESEWQRASLPRRESLSVRYPNQRSVVLDDETNWSPWSSPYRSSGQLNRSPGWAPVFAISGDVPDRRCAVQLVVSIHSSLKFLHCSPRRSLVRSP